MPPTIQHRTLPSGRIGLMAWPWVLIVTSGVLSLANPVAKAEEAMEKKGDLSNTRNGNKTGFYAMLSPEMGGGEMVWYRGGEMKYLSKEAVMDVRDIKVSTVSSHHVVQVFPNPRSRAYLMEQSKAAQPYIFAIDFLQDGQVVWSRSLNEILGEDWITVGVFDSEKEAEQLAEQLRLEGREKPAVHEDGSAPSEAEQVGLEPTAIAPNAGTEGEEKPNLESKE